MQCIKFFYSFNPLALLDILPLPTNESANLDGKKKVEFVKDLYTTVWANIERKNEQFAKEANKGHVKVIFEPRYWVWVHMRKE